MTPLHIAVEAGNSQMVEMLFNVADDKNPAMTNGRTPLHIAAQFGDIDTIRLICPEVILRILVLKYYLTVPLFNTYFFTRISI